MDWKCKRWRSVYCRTAQTPFILHSIFFVWSNKEDYTHVLVQINLPDSPRSRKKSRAIDCKLMADIEILAEIQKKAL